MSDQQSEQAAFELWARTDSPLRHDELRAAWFAWQERARRASQAPSEGADALRKLAAFGAWCAEEFRESLSDVDGGSAQDAMERCGVIVKRTVEEPCGEGCVCIEYGDFPHECYTFPAEIRATIAAEAAGDSQPGGER